MKDKIRITKERNEHLKTGETWSDAGCQCPECHAKTTHAARELRVCVICGYQNYEVAEEKIKCAGCDRLTDFVPSDFDKDKDLDDLYCSEECRYHAETGNPGEEY